MWIFLGAASYLFHVVIGKDSPFIENFYSRGIFVGFRWLWDHTLGFSFIPLLYVFLAAAVLWDIWRISKYISQKNGRTASSFFTKLRKGLLLGASLAGMLAFFFYALWGFNYNRIRVEKQLRLDVTPIDFAAVKAEAEWAMQTLAAERAAIPGASAAPLSADSLPRDCESIIRRSLKKVLKDAGFPAPGRARVRLLRPGGLLMRFSSTGFYFPYCGEGYAAGNLTAAERPFVIAHEMVHAFGLTDEGEANFLGFLACESSEVPSVRYSGLFSYWGYVSSEFAHASPEEASEVAKRLPEAVRADIRTARENWDRYRGPLRKTAQAVYERYLKSQGVEGGIKSYDRFVSLVMAWKRR